MSGTLGGVKHTARSAGLVALALLLACAGAAPSGPLFEPLPAPAEGRLLLYVYRQDEVRSGGSVRVSVVGGGSTGSLRDGEYLVLELAEGAHELALTLRAGWGLPRGWNRFRLEAGADRILYVHVWTDLDEVDSGPAAAEAGGDFGAPGRASRAAALNVFASRLPTAQALPAIRACRRAAPDAR